MPQPASNTRLKSARLAAGFRTQTAFADALGVGVRQVRRWESPNPPWPHADLQDALTRATGQTMEALGFQRPPGHDGATEPRPQQRATPPAGLAAVPVQAAAAMQPATVAADYESVTRAHRRLYWSVAPATLHPAVIAHATLGCALLPETAGQTRAAVASALGESWLLAGRIEFFDLQEPDRAAATLLRALQAAGEADDQLLGSAVLAHTAFIPAWAGRRDDAVQRLVAARTYARRGPAPALLLAWLDAVEAECETRAGNYQTALHLIGHGEDLLAAAADDRPVPVPEWLDWFSPVRLAAFRGNTQLQAGHVPQARTTLSAVLEQLPASEEKQRSVILGDLAAVEVAAGAPDAACDYALRGLDQLERTWYATGMDRIRDVRRSLTAHQHEPCVRALDERLYGWSTTVSALAR